MSARVRRPRRSALEEIERHEECVIAAATLVHALAGLYPEIAELRTAEMCLEISRKEMLARKEAAREAARDTTEPTLAEVAR